MYSRLLSLLCVVLLITGALAKGREKNASESKPVPDSQFSLTEAHLQAAGLRFAPEFKSIEDVTTHCRSAEQTQQIKLTWDSFPGHTLPLTATEANRLQVSRKFVVQSRELLSESPNVNAVDRMYAHTFLFVAIGKSNQIRGMLTQRDPRLMSVEQPLVKGRLGGGTLYQPKAEFTLRFPNDPDIRRILVYEPRHSLEGFQLDLLAEVELPKHAK